MAQKTNKTVLGAIGAVCVVVGVGLILAWWPSLVVVFKGVAGFALALAGMFILYTVRE